MYSDEKDPVDSVQLTDAGPDVARFTADLLRGLSASPRYIPSKYFYDARGSELFDRITKLDEYYLTRAELEIMQEHVGEMVALIGPRCLLVEYGSGSSLKTRILLDRLADPAGYVPIDISKEHLERTAESLAQSYPGLEVLPVSADYTTEFSLPRPSSPYDRIVVYFPGSTIGNFTESQAQDFLWRVRNVCGPSGALLIGVDLQKDPEVIEAAYNDRAGVTAEFNKNLLVRANRELGADFDPDGFAHRAVYNQREGRIEMYLISLRDQEVHIAGEAIRLEEGERICTELSHKYTLEGFASMAESASFAVERVWTDSNRLFSVQYLTAAERVD